MAKNDFLKLDRKKGLYLKDTPTKGRGLFCVTAIKAGEELERTPAIILNERESDRVENTILRDYVFKTGVVSTGIKKSVGIKKLSETSCVVMGIASYCNHSESPNAEVVWEESKGSLYYVLQATKAIAKDTEICTTYGDTWFNERKKSEQ